MFGKLGDMMGKLQEAKQKAEEIKRSLEGRIVSGSAAGGDVHVSMTGTRKVTEVKIAASVQHGDAAALQEHLKSAINNAIQAADKLSEEEMKKVAGDMLPGGLGGLGNMLK